MQKHLESSLIYQAPCYRLRSNLLWLRGAALVLSTTTTAYIDTRKWIKSEKKIKRDLMSSGDSWNESKIISLLFLPL